MWFQVAGAGLGAPEVLPLPFQAAIPRSRSQGTAAVAVPGSRSRIRSSRAAAYDIPCGSRTDTEVFTGNPECSDLKSNMGHNLVE